MDRPTDLRMRAWWEKLGQTKLSSQVGCLQFPSDFVLVNVVFSIDRSKVWTSKSPARRRTERRSSRPLKLVQMKLRTQPVVLDECRARRLREDEVGRGKKQSFHSSLYAFRRYALPQLLPTQIGLWKDRLHWQHKTMERPRKRQRTIENSRQPQIFLTRSRNYESGRSVLVGWNGSPGHFGDWVKADERGRKQKYFSGPRPKVCERSHQGQERKKWAKKIEQPLNAITCFLRLYGTWK